MTRTKGQRNGHLEEAIALLLQNQASFLARATAMDERFAKSDERHAEVQRRNDERFARIEAILLDMRRLLERLPEAVREKIGFKSS